MLSTVIASWTHCLGQCAAADLSIGVSQGSADGLPRLLRNQHVRLRERQTNRNRARMSQGSILEDASPKNPRHSEMTNDSSQQHQPASLDRGGWYDQLCDRGPAILPQAS